MRAPITDKQLLEMMWEQFPEIMKRGTEQPAQQEEPTTKHTEPFESARVGDYNRGWNDCLFASGIVKQTEQPAQKCSYPYCGCNSKAWCKVERNEALNKKAENARELGLDYEPAPVAKPHEQEPVLQDIEQYRLQMAGISTAAIGYWKEGDGIHPDYDTVALRDVAKLYAKYDALYKAQPAQQEPVAWMELLREARDNCKASIVEEGISASRKEYRIDLEARLTAALNTSPPAQRTWVGLTEEELQKILQEVSGQGWKPLLEAIEAKLKEKNT